MHEKTKKLLKKIFKLNSGDAVGLILASLIAGYFWFYVYGPSRKLSDVNWVNNHSETGIWLEEQNEYNRQFEAPELCMKRVRIGYYGNKKWFLWLINKISQKDSESICGCTQSVIGLISNQWHDDWNKWLIKNKDKTQDEWILDGFEQYGIDVWLPVRQEDIPVLLKVMGREKFNFTEKQKVKELTDKNIPYYFVYNAFRCLRDSDFEPLDYIFKQTKPLPEDLKKGLELYVALNRSFPAERRLGLLSISKYCEREDHPTNVSWPNYFISAIIIIVFFTGIIVLVRLHK